jgi:photosystem II stability/assembly factor-like uncharacterized protein
MTLILSYKQCKLTAKTTINKYNMKVKLILTIVITFIDFTANAQWLETAPINSDIFSLATKDATIFAGTSGLGIFSSTNEGNSWTTVNNGLILSTNYSLTISGTNIFTATLSGIFSSTDNGSNWTAINNGLTNILVKALVISDSNMFAGTEDGIFLSTDNGNNWTPTNSGLTNTSIIALAISDTNIFAGTESGIFLSTNNGNSWVQVNTGLTNTTVVALAISDTNIFAGTTSGVFLSTDNGNNWTSVNSNMTNTAITSLFISDTNIFAGTKYGGLFLSSNNGKSWASINNGLPSNNSITSLTISGGNLFAGTNGANVWRILLSEIVSGINEINVHNSITIYPNPFSTQTILQTDKVFKNATLTLHNSLGQQIRQVNNISGQTVTIHRDNLSSGLYYLQLTQDNQTIATDKLVITD